MQLGIVGLGAIGAGLARRLAAAGTRVLCHDRAQLPLEELCREPNIERAEDLSTLCARLDGERTIVLTLAGDALEDALRALVPLASAGDTIVDAGSDDYRDAMRRALALSQQGLRYIDAGICGAHGVEQGYCLMLGGTPRSVEIFEPFARILAPEPERGWLHCGPNGAGHFARAVYDGIEDAMMQALAEGFVRVAAHPELDIDAARLAATWAQSSGLRSWLLERCAAALDQDETLSGDHARKLAAMLGERVAARPG